MAARILTDINSESTIISIKTLSKLHRKLGQLNSLLSVFSEWIVFSEISGLTADQLDNIISVTDFFIEKNKEIIRLLPEFQSEESLPARENVK